MPLVIYDLGSGLTHMHTYPHENDFKKPQACWPVAKQLVIS